MLAPQLGHCLRVQAGVGVGLRLSLLARLGLYWCDEAADFIVGVCEHGVHCTKRMTLDAAQDALRRAKAEGAKPVERSGFNNMDLESAQAGAWD